MLCEITELLNTIATIYCRSFLLWLKALLYYVTTETLDILLYYVTTGMH